MSCCNKVVQFRSVIADLQSIGYRSFVGISNCAVTDRASYLTIAMRLKLCNTSTAILIVYAQASYLSVLLFVLTVSILESCVFFLSAIFQVLLKCNPYFFLLKCCLEEIALE